ncbi:sulfatase-like hydrolase/transferase [Roseimaritima sediminicola]|uniref:sulfatase-like hydrolase/transferase n=1 Tax=Roseimaritima sediminicola TaxID=2662066 RepID=UPI0012985425|nr:sulfatase-like hydrolase/transferase [Roseimaritima sediminicola]
MRCPASPSLNVPLVLLPVCLLGAVATAVVLVASLPLMVAVLWAVWTAAVSWLVLAAGWIAIAHRLPGSLDRGLGKRLVDFWIPFVGGLWAAHLYVLWVAGRTVWFYLAICFGADAQQWLGSGGVTRHLPLFVPGVATILVSCLAVRAAVSLLRRRQLPARWSRVVTASAAAVLLVGWVGGDRLPPLAHAPQRLPAGWQRQLPTLDARPQAEPRSLEREPSQNIVLVVIESLRPDAVEPETMPFLSRLAEQGTSFPEHYSGANSSLPGLFSLLNGSTASGAAEHLAAQRPLRLLEAMRQSGRETVLIAGGEPSGDAAWGRMLSPAHFDRCLTRSHADWWQGDRWAVEQLSWAVEQRRDDGNRKPMFAVVFLTATHFAYETDTAGDPRFQPQASDAMLLLPADPLSRRGVAIANRYRACAFRLDQILQSQLAHLVDQDLILAVTGDHGQSLYDDGTIAHWSRLSDAQTRVPFVIAGGDARALRIDHPTVHADAAAVLAGLARGRVELPRPRPLLLVQANPIAAYEDWVIVDGASRSAWRRYEDHTEFVGGIDRRGRLLW